jgi:GNAT superfamily N-acetyltransferase
MNTIFYRQADNADIPYLLALLEELFAIEADFNFSAEKQKRGLKLLMQSSSCAVQAALEDREIVGMVSGQLTISTAEGCSSLLIEDLVVKRSLRGQGIGRQLIENIGQWGYSHGASRMQLLADCDNHRGLQFYNVNGWRRTRLICLRKYYNGETT